MDAAILLAGIFFFVVGGVCGWLLGLGGFIEVTNLTDIRKSYRLRNFQYLLGGLFVAIFSDYRKIGLGDNFPTYVPMSCFAAGAIIVFIATIFVTIRSIRRSVTNWNAQRDRDFQVDQDALTREYLQHGKPAFDEKFKAEREANDKREEVAGSTSMAARRRRHLEANKALSACVYGVLHFDVSKATPQDRSALVEAILDAGCAAVRAHSRKPDELELKGSFMRFIPGEKATDKIRAHARFKFDDPKTSLQSTDASRYWGYLELCHGAGYGAGKRVVLPVESAAAPAELTLPGAPTAVREGGFAIMTVKPLTRKDGIEDRIWEEMETFFADAGFASVASVIVSGSGGAHGILNIESSKQDLLGEGDALARAACATLQPVAALLSKFDYANMQHEQEG